MPTPAESLRSDSEDDVIAQAISETVSQLVNEGMPQEQAVAVAHEMARRATGKDLAPKQSRTRRAR